MKRLSFRRTHHVSFHIIDYSNTSCTSLTFYLPCMQIIGMFSYIPMESIQIDSFGTVSC